MFSKSKINAPIEDDDKTSKPASPVSFPAEKSTSPADTASSGTSTQAVAPRVSSGPSVISTDLKIIGNMITEGDLQIEGIVEGDIRANLVTIGESAVIRGEVMADDLIVNGHVIGRIRAIKVRLSASSRVEGDILHKTIAIEAGAQFEGFVNRKEDPLNDTAAEKPSAVKPVAPTMLQPAKTEITDAKATSTEAKTG